MSRRAAALAASVVVATVGVAGATAVTRALHPSRSSVGLVAVTSRATAVPAPVPAPVTAPAPVTRPGAGSGGGVQAGNRAVPTPTTSGPRPAAHAADPAASSYAFLFPARASGPVRWDPCQPIHYVTDIAAAPQLRLDLLAAMARLTAVTGIRFVFDGDTTEHSSSHRPLVEDGRWSPVLVDVATPAESDLLRTGDDGEGVATWWRTSTAGTQIVTGQLVLRAGSAPTRYAGFDDPDAAGPFLLHELGHVLGLGHVSAPGEIMNHDGALRAVGLGPGDLAGLRRLGAAGGCLPVMPAPGEAAASVPLDLAH